MLARLELELTTIDDCKLNVRWSTNLQGVLMEKINPSYAEKLHTDSYHPYSQYLIKREKIYWIINTFDIEAYEQIIEPLLNTSFESFSIKKDLIKIHINSKKLIKKNKSELLEEFYHEDAGKYFSLEFVTVTSFKSNNKYVIYPDLSLFFRSLMKKYSFSSDDITMFDEETLEEIVNNCYITQYRLKSDVFLVEKGKIPGFRGAISIKVTGNKTISNYIYMLLKFGEFSGVGVKTGMGMGAIRLIKDEGDKSDGTNSN